MTSQNEQEKPAAEISWLGRLDGGKPNPKIWRGAISATYDVLKSRFGFDRDEETAQFIQEQEQKVGKYFVKADPGAAVRCIDGRNGDGEPGVEPKLGPQIAGGTPAAVISYRLARFEEAKENIVEDFKEVQDLLEELGIPFEPGGHEDDHNEHSEVKTGCGAIDKMLEILELMSSEETRQLIRGYAEAISGEHFDESIFDDILQKLDKLNQPEFRDRYFMKDEESGNFTYGNALIRAAKKTGKKAVEKLRGDHNEILLVVNKRAGETFNRDQYAMDNDNKAQAFNYDFWFTVARADSIFPDDDTARRTVIISNAMYAAATCMALTDGSLEVGIRE